MKTKKGYKVPQRSTVKVDAFVKRQKNCHSHASGSPESKLFIKFPIRNLFLFTVICCALLMTSMAHAAGAVNLPKTGQTKCYDTAGAEITCAGTGQDGDIKAGLPWPSPRFTSGTHYVWPVRLGQSGSSTSIPLTSGWNLISTPIQPTDTAIAAVLTSIPGSYTVVWAYMNGGWKLYDPSDVEGTTLATMEAGAGYWIKMASAKTLAISGTTASTSISLGSGWNLVGYNKTVKADASNVLMSIANKYTVVWAYINGGWKLYDPSDVEGSTLKTFEPGYGYWIKMKEAATWSQSGGDGPTAPAGVTASVGDGQVSISWNPVSGAISYNIYWSTTSGVTKTNGTKITGATSPYSHTERTNGTTYYYIVTAVNSFGESVESARVSATPAAAGTYTASGTWSWNSGTSTLTMNWTSSTFSCNGPSLGTETMTSPTITATTMTMGDMTWTRSPGPAGDARGTWTATDSGNTYTLVISGGTTSGTMSLTAIIVSCGDDGGSNPGIQTQYWPGNSSDKYKVDMWYDDSPKTASAVSVTGPGITGSQALSYYTSGGYWNLDVNLGTTSPTGLPFTYTFSITDTTTWTATATVSCFQERFATNLSPTGTVAGTPTFSWTGIGDSSAKYKVELNDSNYNRIWESDKISGTSIVYGGPALTSGVTYNYFVVVTSSSTCSSERSFASGSFTHQ